MLHKILSVFFTFFISLLIGQNNLSDGKWTGYLQLEENITLPFNFRVTNNTIEIQNNQEKIELIANNQSSDSMHYSFPNFNSFLRFVIIDANNLNGYWYNKQKGENYKIPFYAHPNLTIEDKTSYNISGKWEATFGLETEKPYKAIGEFEQNETQLTGTFLTKTGDYRYLSGFVQNDKMVLSTFNGAFVFLFIGTIVDNFISGTFYSGNHWKTKWEARPNSSFELQDATKLTYHKDTLTPLSFSLPDLNGDTLNFPNSKFNNKVVIIQIMGSWCPNCLDEANFFEELMQQYHNQGLEIISICYEIPKTMGQKIETVKRMIARNNFSFHFLIGGNAQKNVASSHFPMISDILSFPTAIYLDKNGKIAHIHTGFSGPGTGIYYDNLKKETINRIEKLLLN